MRTHVPLSLARFRRKIAALVVGSLPLLSACGGSGATDTTPPTQNPPTQNPPTQNPGYTTTTIGGLSGDNQSTAFAANSAGQVVGQSTDGNGLRAFYWDGSLHNLTTAGSSGVAYAISNGSTVYAGGYQQATGGVRQAVRWTPASSSTPTVLETVDSYVLGLNDAGTAVGRYLDPNSAVHGAIWPLGGTRIDIPPLAGGTHTAAQDINNDGIVVGISFGATSDADRAWVRLTDGELVQLPGLAGAIGTQALAISDVVNGQFYVVGTNYNQAAVRQGIRWTFQLATKTTTQETSGDMSQATGVTNQGAVSGISISAPSSRGVLWRNGVTLLLGPAGTNSGARGIATSATGSVYVAGDVFSGGLPAATRWTVP
jgi:probable HAF family extracellular repeat protein